MKAQEVLKNYTHAIRRTKVNKISKEEILYSFNNKLEGWFYIGDEKHPHPFGRPRHIAVTETILKSDGWEPFGQDKKTFLTYDPR